MPDAGKILVIRGGAIGDFILTLPVFAALRRQFPKARLGVLGYPHIAQLALAGGLVDEVQPIEARRLAGFFARGGELAPELADFFSEVDVIVSYLYDPDEIFQMNVARCTPAQFITGPHRPDEAAGVHATEVFLKPLERLAVFDADLVPRLSLNPRPPADLPAAPPLWRAGAAAQAGPSTLNQLALHPGSGSETKNWPEAKWGELLQHLARDTKLNFLLVGGEAEQGSLERLASILPARRCRVARSLPLTELAKRLAPCSAFIGHDSGISHLAAALGLPGLILWGPTPEAVWRPQGERILVLREPAGLTYLSVARVVNELRRLL